MKKLKILCHSALRSSQNVVMLARYFSVLQFLIVLWKYYWYLQNKPITLSPWRMNFFTATYSTNLLLISKTLFISRTKRLDFNLEQNAVAYKIIVFKRYTSVLYLNSIFSHWYLLPNIRGPFGSNALDIRTFEQSSTLRLMEVTLHGTPLPPIHFFSSPWRDQINEKLTGAD